MQDNYAKINRECLEDLTISFSAKGVYAMLVAFQGKTLMRPEQSKEYNAAIAELEKAGYVKISISDRGYTQIEPC